MPRFDGPCVRFTRPGASMSHPTTFCSPDLVLERLGPLLPDDMEIEIVSAVSTNSTTNEVPKPATAPVKVDWSRHRKARMQAPEEDPI